MCSTAASTNVESQQSAPDSTLTHYRTLIAARAASPALRQDDFAMVPAEPESGGSQILAYARRHPSQTVILTTNFDNAWHEGILLDLSELDLPARPLVDLLTGETLATVDGEGQAYPAGALEPYGWRLLATSPSLPGPDPWPTGQG